MSSHRTHRYRVTVNWLGNLGSGTSNYSAYGRDHQLNAPGKATTISGSADPAFRGDGSRYNPEELLLGAISSCHMLWVLHLCADAGIVVTLYSDEATGELVQHPDSSGEFTVAVLRPRMVITDASRIREALAMHDRAHSLCFVARSVAFPVKHEPTVTA
ncbi:MAG TPA: OsmC family protein [Bryobacteraceae bacterium]|nr:OsmC family protein [Bryobacteraceae bacterium]